MTNAKCSQCGKEFDISDKPEALQRWFLNPDNAAKVKCPDCHGQAASSKPKAGTQKGSGKDSQANNEKKNGYGYNKTKVEITPAMLHKAYDEIKAEFADIFEEVHPFLGAWATTLVLNKVK